MPKVSVIVPVYNVEKYLERCMRSLMKQTLHDIEIIMVNDGSPDHCPQMCEKYAEKDSRIKVIHKMNAGLGLARNSGLEAATGEYVAFVDSDDYVDVKMYESLYLSAIHENADAAFCGFYIEMKKGVWAESREVDENKVWVGDEINNFMLDMIACAPYEKQERKYQMSVWHAVYRRSLIGENKINFISERDVVSEDIPFQVDFLKKARKITYLKDNVYSYCLNDSSLTKSFKLGKYTGFKKLREVLIGKLGDEKSTLRVNRQFIGYCRSYVGDLVMSRLKDKKDVLYKIQNDPIWDEIANTYPPKFLPINSRIYYLLTLQKSVWALFLYAKIICFIKKLR